jgi:hypothetical protein
MRPDREVGNFSVKNSNRDTFKLLQQDDDRGVALGHDRVVESLAGDFVVVASDSCRPLKSRDGGNFE